MKDLKRFRNEFTEAFVDRLQRAREGTPERFTHDYVALHIGMGSKNGYGQYERGKSDPAPWRIKLLCDLFGVSPNWLFGVPDKPDELTEDEQHLLSLYRQVKQAGRQSLALGVMETLTKSTDQG